MNYYNLLSCVCFFLNLKYLLIFVSLTQQTLPVVANNSITVGTVSSTNLSSSSSSSNGIKMNQPNKGLDTSPSSNNNNNNNKNKNSPDLKRKKK
jgi:hypothetical protein